MHGTCKRVGWSELTCRGTTWELGLAFPESLDGAQFYLICLGEGSNAAIRYCNFVGLDSARGRRLEGARLAKLNGRTISRRPIWLDYALFNHVRC